MELFVPNANRDSVTYYKLAKNYWKDKILEGAILPRDYSPTVVKEESFETSSPKETDIFYLSGSSDVFVLDCYDKESLGKTLASNVGVACSGCDHSYEDVYNYKYRRYYLIKELASAIRCYYSALNFDIASARANLSRIKDCLSCSRSDLLYIFNILNSLSFDAERRFTNLDDLAYFILSSNSFDRAYSLNNYKKSIEGLSISDICSNTTSNDSYVILEIKSKLGDIRKGRELLDFMPEVKSKEEELSRILWK